MLIYTRLAVCLSVFFCLLYCSPIVPAGEVREDCRICGMWIDQYMHTRHVLTAQDGARISFCSFTCAAKYLKKHEQETNKLQVADYRTADLVDAKEAFYLLGSDAPPVMSNTSIIAFASIEAAESFRKLHGGRMMTFPEVLAHR